MRLLTLILTFGLLTNLYGQTNSAIATVLKKEFSENSITDGRWIYYSDKADIKKIEKPHVKAAFSNYDFYQVTMTNCLGYHINQGTCIILFDSLESKAVLIEPIWYGGVSEQLIKLALKKRFDNKEKLLSFLNELNELMEIGSEYKFINTCSTDDLLKYDLVYFKGDSLTTGGNDTSSTVNYTSDCIWRQIEIKIKNSKIIEYTSINPALKDNKEFKKDYKETIK
jgi:hypothetical protein